MKKISFQIKERAMSLIADCSLLVKMYETKDEGFSTSLRKWLSQTEEFFKENKFPELGLLSSLRASAIAAENGIFNSEIETSPMLKRKKKMALYIQMLQTVSGYLYNVYNAENEKIENARIIVNQVVLVALQNKLIPNNLLQMADSSCIQNIWGIISSNEELKKGLNQVLISVSVPDVIRLIDDSVSGITAA